MSTQMHEEVKRRLSNAESLDDLSDDQIAAAMVAMFGSVTNEALRAATMAAVQLRASSRTVEQTRALVDATAAFREAMEQAANAARGQASDLAGRREDSRAVEGQENRQAARSSARLQFWGQMVAGA